VGSPGGRVGANLGDIISFISATYNTPAAYLALTFAFSILVAVILPIPIEVVLLAPIVYGQWAYLGSVVLAMAAGKTVGAWLVFYLGVHIEDNIRHWSEKYRIADRFVKWCERFVRKTNYVGLYVLLSIPLMSDTIPLYVYSLFNEEGKALDTRAFLVSNFLAAWTRAGILTLVFVFFNVLLVR
jgi:membrane protein YqaA with SNARE-associated domain